MCSMDDQHSEQPMVDGRRDTGLQSYSLMEGDGQRPAVGRQTDHTWCRCSGAQHTVERRLQRKHNMVCLQREREFIQKFVADYRMLHQTQWRNWVCRQWRRVADRVHMRMVKKSPEIMLKQEINRECDDQQQCSVGSQTELGTDEVGVVSATMEDEKHEQRGQQTCDKPPTSIQPMTSTR